MWAKICRIKMSVVQLLSAAMYLSVKSPLGQCWVDEQQKKKKTFLFNKIYETNIYDQLTSTK